MQTALTKSQQRLDRNADDERTQKERVLQDLTDSLMRVVSGRPSRRNSGELEAIKKALAAEIRVKKKEKSTKADTKGNAQKQAKKGKQA